MVEAQIHAVKATLELAVKSVNNILWMDPQPTGAQHDRNTMFIRPTNEDDIFALHPEITAVNVCR